MFDHKEIEEKYNKIWEKEKIYKSKDSNKKIYVLDMFPYPSGLGLHVGHTKGYTATDVYSRAKKMQGYCVLHPMGWDAFGLPAEKYAIEHKTHPKKTTKENTDNFREQLKKLGLSYDWDREINTTEEDYYKWTQWIFLKLYEAGLAYSKLAPINWCPSCKTGLANEDLEQGKCEICGSVIEKKNLNQWYLKITDYADRLLKDLSLLTEWEDYVKVLQKQWIGKSEGHSFLFNLSNGESVEVFTTRPETIYGCSFIALSPNNKDVEKIKGAIKNKDAVEKYIKDCFAKKADEEKDKSGVLLDGIYAQNPASKEQIPIFLADYVLDGYGTGAIFGCPAEDERDFEFAKEHNLPIKEIIKNDKLINSEELDGLSIKDAVKKITEKLKSKKTTNYKLQDWTFSRQRYWGEPIPLIHCKDCGVVPVKEEDLPVKLPEIENYEPTGTGESPLTNIKEFVEVKCSKCGGNAKRETNTMPQWAGSSWYYLRFIDPKNKKEFVDSKKEKEFMPVDLYVGGIEHATRHLIYARFWHKFLYDKKLVSSKEPFKKFIAVGLLNAEDGQKISKRKDNGANPLDVIRDVGADTLRMYILSLGPFTKTAMWNNKAIAGPRRFLERVFVEVDNIKDVAPSEELLSKEQKTILEITKDIDNFRFNTAISKIMIFFNDIKKEKQTPRSTYITLLKLLSPFCPFITQELYSKIGEKGHLYEQEFPLADFTKIKEDEVKIAVQVDGKIKGEILAPMHSKEEDILKLINSDEKIKKHLKGKNVKVFIENKIISFI